MSDYISKSALLKHLWDWRLQECPVGVCDEETETYKTICECIKAVEEQPTIDEKEIIRKTVERIIEKFKHEEQEYNELRKFHKENGTKSMECLYIGKIGAFKDAIEICKEEGGIE